MVQMVHIQAKKVQVSEIAMLVYINLSNLYWVLLYS